MPVQEYSEQDFGPRFLDVINFDSVGYGSLIGEMELTTRFDNADEAVFEIFPPITVPKSIRIEDEYTAMLIAKPEFESHCKWTEQTFSRNRIRMAEHS